MSKLNGKSKNGRKLSNVMLRPEYDRKVHSMLNLIARQGISFKEVINKVEKELGWKISHSWLYSVRRGPKFNGTRYPAGWRVDAVLEVLGYQTPVVPIASVAAIKNKFTDNLPVQYLPAPKKTKKKIGRKIAAKKRHKRIALAA